MREIYYGSKSEKSNGITLIALVITIIVLVILGGITISKLIDNGLLENTQLAKEKTENEQNKEKIEINKYSDTINDYISGSREYETEINNLKTEIEKLKNNSSYSMTEKIVGTWIDGKTLYKRTFDYGSSINVSNTVWTDTKVSISENNIDHVIKAEAVSEGTSQNDCCWALHAHTEDSVTNVHVLAPRVNTVSCKYFTFYYTKTIE